MFFEQPQTTSFFQLWLSYDTHRRTMVLRFNGFRIEISQYNYSYVAIFIAVICSGIVSWGRIYWDYLLFIWTSHSWPETNWEADCREKTSHKSPVIIPSSSSQTMTAWAHYFYIISVLWTT